MLAQTATKDLTDTLQSVSGAATNQTFEDTEMIASAMASTNPCLIPEMPNELYDCCGGDVIEDTCNTFGYANFTILGGILLVWGYLVFCNEWFRNQLLLSFTFFFQLLPAFWRSWFYLYSSHKGETAFNYMLFRASDSGYFVISMVAFALYLYQVQQKYARANDPGFDYHKLRKRLCIGFFSFFAIYAGYWSGVFYYRWSLRNLAWIDFATSGWFAIFIVVYLVLGTRLIKAINKMRSKSGKDPERAPGVL